MSLWYMYVAFSPQTFESYKVGTWYIPYMDNWLGKLESGCWKKRMFVFFQLFVYFSFQFLKIKVTFLRNLRPTKKYLTDTSLLLIFHPYFLYYPLSPISKHEKFCHSFTWNWEAKRIETWYTWGMCQILCILESGCSCLSLRPLFFFLPLQFSVTI